MGSFCPWGRSPFRFIFGSRKMEIRKFSSVEAAEKRSHLFTLEKKRQLENVGRIDKIEVRYLGTPKDLTLFMNKDISTPFDCARHMSAVHTQRSGLGLVDGNLLWDMHRPLTHSCTLELLHFMANDPIKVNVAYWRTCSFLLGAIISRTFKENFEVKLHSFPSPDIRSGSFVYDAELCGLSDWKPTNNDMRILGCEFVRFCSADLPIERLTVSRELALLMFEDNEHKTRQIPDIAQKNEGQVILYRVGNHVDISKGPMIGNTNLVGRCSATAVHTFSGIIDGRDVTLHRFQGVSIPAGFVTNHMVFDILVRRAKNLNPARSPFETFSFDNHNTQDIPVQAVA